MAEIKKISVNGVEYDIYSESTDLSEIQAKVDELSQEIESTSSSIQSLNDSLNTVNESITEEVSKREEADQELQSSIDSLKELVESIETEGGVSLDQVESLIESEKTEREAKDEELQNSINELSEKVDSIETEGGVSLDVVESLVEAEKSEREAKDEELDAKIETLNSTITTINESITEESDARKESDQELQSSIDSLSERVETLESNSGAGSDSNAEELVEAEKAERVAKDEELESSIASINAALDNKVEYTDISTEENPERKAIVLGNHDTILGTATTGSTYNLAMISKWDVADFGTSSLPINLNGYSERPTYNDDKQIAFVEDIPSTDNFATKEELEAKQDTLEAGSNITIEGNTISANVNVDLSGIEESLENKTDEKIEGTNGTSYVWNESSGGGARFVHNDGTESYVGVNDGGEDGMVAQIYADKATNDGTWEGSVINVYRKGIFYHQMRNTGDSSYSGDSEAREIAVKGDLESFATKEELEAKQDVLVAGEGIAINDNVISASIEEVDLSDYAKTSDIPENVSDLVNDAGYVTTEELEAKDYQTSTQVSEAISALVNSAPETLDTLQELAAALGNDPEFATTITTQLGQKLDTSIYEADKVTFALQADLDTLEETVENKTDEMIEGTNGTSYVWNERSGGGARFVNNDNTTSFVGVNDGGEEGITAQIYSKDSTTNVGTRLNVYNKGIFYITGKSTSDADYVADGEDYELAVKGDLADFATKEELGAKQDKLTAGDNVSIDEEGVISANIDLSTIEDALSNKTDEMIEGTNGKSYIWNETSGGGIRFVNNDNTVSCFAVNDGGADGIVAQVYAKDNDSTTVTRLNIFKKGMYYIPNMARTDEGYSDDGANFELAVKGDLSEFITEAEVEAKGYQTAAQVDEAIAAIVSSAPETLDTLQELAAALGDDPNFAATVTEQIGKKLDAEVYEGDKETFALKTDLEAKQDTLTAGDNISIEDNVISASIDLSEYLTKEEVSPLVEAGIEAAKTAVKTYNLGNFETLDALSTYLGYHEYYNNTDRVIYYFTVANTDCGVVINNMGDMVDGLPYTSRQYMYYQEHRYTRTVRRNSTTGSVTATDWVIEDNVTLSGKGVDFYALSQLTTDSTDAEIQAALTYPNGNGVVTEEDLDACIEKGMFLKEYNTNSQVMVGMTMMNSKYILTYIGYPLEERDVDTSKSVCVKSVILTITDGVYAIAKAADDEEVLTTSWEKYPVELKIPIWGSGLSDRVYDESTILGWFGVDSVSELKSQVKNSALVSMLYLNSGDMYYRIPVQFIELRDSDNQIHLVTVGVDMYDDSATRYEITMNLDGTIIESESNVKVVKTALLTEDDLTEKISTLESAIRNMEERLAILEDTSTQG